MPMIKSIEEQRVILSFDDGTVLADSSGSGEIEHIDLNLRDGDLALVHLENQQQATTLCNACAGLVEPRRGAVKFLSRDWRLLPPTIANALRGRIGCVFASGNWINSFSLLENILLSQLHHTRRPAQQLRDEAGELARRFGLPGVPLGRPVDCTPDDLQRAACVRAFLGQPSLILLEDPASGGLGEVMPCLINVIRETRDRGGAVMWLTLDNITWRDSSIPVSGRYRLAGRRLSEVTR